MLLALLLLPAAWLRAAAAQPQEAPPPPPLLVERLLGDASFKVRVQAAITLSRFPSPQGMAALVKALEDEHPAVRAAAAISLGRIGFPAARHALTAACDDPDQLVADAAHRALALLAAQTPTPPPPTAGTGNGGGEAGFTVSGPGLASSRSPAEVQQALATLTDPLRQCSVRQLKRDPGFRGVQLKLRILPDGQALLAPQNPPPLDDPRFRGCVEQALAGLHLPRAAGGEQNVTWPLEISP